MEELMQCMKCGEWLPRSKLELMKTGTRRRVCNHCKWLYYVKPSRERAILRELEQKHSFRPPKPEVSKLGPKAFTPQKHSFHQSKAMLLQPIFHFVTFPDLTRHFFSLLTESVDSRSVVVLNR